MREGLKNFIWESPEDKIIALKKSIQIELAERAQMNVVEWIDKHAKGFNAIFNPSLMEEMEENHDKTMEEIEKKLYYH